jgi:hypothetical protein
MGVDLMGNGGYSMNWAGWRSMLKLAQMFGWCPAGTMEMDYLEGHWSHPNEATYAGKRLGYFSNDGQLVTDPDASALAAVLRRALAHPSQPIVSSRVNFKADKVDRNSVDAIVSDVEIAMADPFPMDCRLLAGSVEEFAEYCENGGFRIH